MSKAWPAVVAFALGCVAWEAVRYFSHLPPIILPSLQAIGTQLLAIHELWYNTRVTAQETVVGFVLGNSIAVLIAVAILRWPRLESAIVPYAIGLKTTPVAAFVPILIIWFGTGFASKAIAAASVCFFPTLINGVRGLRAVDQDYLDLFAVWRVGWWRSLIRLRLPSALPYLFAALKLSSSLALVGAVVAEFVAADAGLGFLIVVFSRRLETPEMFATILVCTILGVAGFLGVVGVEQLMRKRYRFLAKRGELF